MKKSFTLIELLIVIGILSILVVTILITLNPSEAQKKARDTKRMKDLSTLEAIVLQNANDGNPPFCTAPGGCTSTTAPVGATSEPCDTSWLQEPAGTSINLCKYASTIPVDPANGQQRSYVYGAVSNPQTAVTQFRYMLRMEGSDYQIMVFQESKSNINNVANDGDGGNLPSWAVRCTKCTLLGD